MLEDVTDGDWIVARVGVKRGVDCSINERGNALINGERECGFKDTGIGEEGLQTDE